MNPRIDEKVCAEIIRRPIAEIMRENTEHLLKCEDLMKQITSSLVNGVNTDCGRIKPSADCMREEAENQSVALRGIVETLSFVLKVLGG